MTDAGNFEAFVRRHQDMVYATALRLLANPAEAEDVSQNVFLKAFQRFDHLRHSETAAGWLKAVTRNACLNHLTRYRARWRFFSEIDPEGSDRLDNQAGAEVSAADSLEQADERQQLMRGLRALPAHQRVSLVLYHFEDLSYQDIAVALHVSVAKVKTDIHRARLALRRYLGALDARP
jgi:RNA polymerase sigma-70 factor (ECF subfamily)